MPPVAAVTNEFEEEKRMNKAELIAAVAEKTGMSKKDTEAAPEA